MNYETKLKLILLNIKKKEFSIFYPLESILFYCSILNKKKFQIYLNLKKKYNNNHNLIKKNLNFIIYSIKNNFRNNEIKENILRNLVIYKFLQDISVLENNIIYNNNNNNNKKFHIL